MRKLLLATLLLCPFAVANTKLDSIPVAFDGDTLIASGLPPGATVVLFAAITSDVGGIPRLSRVATTAVDEDRDGVVRFRSSREIPATSVWAVVEVSSGRLAIASTIRCHPCPPSPARSVVHAQGIRVRPGECLAESEGRKAGDCNPPQSPS